LSSTEKRSTFSNFDKLAQLLRYEFLPPGRPEKELNCLTKGIPGEPCTLENSGQLSVVLNFKMATATPLEEIRISALPLLRETSSTPGGGKVTIRSLTLGPKNQHSVTEECVITLQKLRSDVAKAMMDDVFANEDHYETHIWINRLGDVVENEYKDRTDLDGEEGQHLGTASTMKHDGHWFQIAYLHLKGLEYRGRKDRHNCRFEDCKQCFPFKHAASEAFRYLAWVLDYWHPNWSRDFPYVNIILNKRPLLIFARLFDKYP
jgi:hypothetical protein